MRRRRPCSPRPPPSRRRWSPRVAAGSASVAVGVVGQPEAALHIQVRRPRSEMVPAAPTTAVFPDTATESRKGHGGGGGIGQRGRWVVGQPEGPLDIRYAAPAPVGGPGAPTMALFPDTATELPKSSPPAAAGSVSVAVGMVGQPDAPFTYTYAAPAQELVPWLRPRRPCSPRPPPTMPKPSADVAAGSASVAVGVVGPPEEPFT